MARPRLYALLLQLSLLAPASLQAQAQSAVPLRIEASAERMRVDGALHEWKGAHFVELGSGDDASLRYALATADGGLYLGVEVRDERLVSGEQGDALVLTLATPEVDGPSWITSEVSLFPGEVGKSKAHARVITAGRPRSESGIQVVEGPRKAGAGYVIEAFVPWTAVAFAQIWEQGRGSLRFVDVDGKGSESTLATATGTGAQLPRLVLGEGSRDLLGSFVEARQLEGVEPRYDLRSNVSGDAQPERVVIIDRYIVVYGPGYKRGETFNYFALPYSVGGGLKSAALVDLTGDGLAELTVTVHQPNQFGTRDAWLVLSLSDEAIAQRFGVELRREAAGGFVEDTLTLLPPTAGSKVRRIEVKSGRSQGLDATRYHEQPATDIEPILLPWGELESRRYAFDGQQFSLLDETRRKASTKLASVPLTSAGSKPPSAPAPLEAAEPAVDELLALFKTQQKLARDAKSSRTLRANVLKGGAEERIDVFGNVLVFTGADVALGRGYVTYTVPVPAARDLLELRAVDVTADGNEELLARIRQPLLGVEGVERELLLVLTGDDTGGLARALLAEVARRHDQSAIENHIVTQAGALVIEPGAARGWNQVSYPFAPAAIAGAAPLLLPWKDRPTRYHRQGSLLVPVP
ncbi:MAG: hypothetical protein JWN04_3998 [Myxococcaceae bacterium]|nr:hypothetical protein [Myxococcaceae bacterium]